MEGFLDGAEALGGAGAGEVGGHVEGLEHGVGIFAGEGEAVYRAVEGLEAAAFWEVEPTRLRRLDGVGAQVIWA